MTWIFFTVLVLVVGAVAAFGIYSWGWHESDSGSSQADERALAEAYARQVINRCDTCEVENLHRAAPGVWEFTTEWDSDRYCGAIEVAAFHANADRSFSGFSWTTCT